MQQPRMILADEPVASLDPVLAHSILGHLEELNRVDRITVLCSLHYLDLVQRYASRVIGLRGRPPGLARDRGRYPPHDGRGVQGDLRRGCRAHERGPPGAAAEEP